MVDRPTKRQPVAIAVIEAGTTIRLVSGNHDHGIATSASWYEKRNLAGPLAGGCSKLPASSTAPSKRMRWSETRLTSVCVSASNVHQPIRSSMTSLNFASTHPPTNNSRPAASDRAQGGTSPLQDHSTGSLRVCSPVLMRVPKIPKRTREIYVGRTAIRRVVEALERLEDPKAGASPWWLLVALLLALGAGGTFFALAGAALSPMAFDAPETRPRRRGPGSSSSALSGLPRFVPLLSRSVLPRLGGGGS